MNFVPASNRNSDPRRWLALLLAALVFGTAIAGAAHAADLGGHDAGEVCEICAIPGGDSGALPSNADTLEPDLAHRCVVAVAERAYARATAGDAQPRAPPA